MYREFYNLTQNPFGETPDTRFFYKSKGQTAAFSVINEMISQGHGFALITGEIGTGKTLFGRMLLNNCEKIADTAIILNPALDREDLVCAINHELLVTPPEGKSLHAQLAALSAHLISNAEKKINTIVFIDEAQHLSHSALETLRLLSNIECESRKLIQIILCGQPELKTHIQHPQLRQLNQRITQEVELEPLTREEISQYIKCRIDIAGGTNFLRFNEGAHRLIYKLTEGNPRLINMLCQRSLNIGFEHKSRIITENIINKAAASLNHFKPLRWYERVFDL